MPQLRSWVSLRDLCSETVVVMLYKKIIGDKDREVKKILAKSVLSFNFHLLIVPERTP